MSDVYMGRCLLVINALLALQTGKRKVDKSTQKAKYSSVCYDLCP